MKLLISYSKPTEEIIEVPKKYEFKFLKDEDDWTDEEWELNDEWCDKIRADMAEEEALIEEYFKDSEADRVISEMKEFP